MQTHPKHFNINQRPWLILACTILIGFTGCVGPVKDSVGTNFRAAWIARQAQLPTPYANVQTKAERNEFIDEYVAIKNIQFHNYVTAIRRGSAYGNLTADGSRLILDGLAATTGGVALKAGLAAASAGITGFTGSVKKDVLFDQALPSFIEKMEELRANKLADITLKKHLSIDEYSRSEAFNDVEEYGADGTFDSALRALNVQTGQATAQAKADLSVTKGDVVSAAANGPASERTSALTRQLAPRTREAITEAQLDAMIRDREARKTRRPDTLKFIQLLDLIDGFKQSSAAEKAAAFAEVVKVTTPRDPAKPVKPTFDSLNFHFQETQTPRAETDGMKAVLRQQVNLLGAKEIPPVTVP
jgi:hypothetical protein